MKHVKNKIISENKGFSLIEALIAVIILAIVSVLMVQGVSMARRAYSSNKIKTEATALANQEIEKIRSMSFSDIGIVSGNPSGTIELQTVVNNFTVNRSVSWVTDSNNSKKQVKIIVSNPALPNSIKVVTEITPLEMIIAGESTTSSSSTTTTVSATTTTVPATTTTVPATTTTVPATTTTIPATTTTVPATTTTITQYPAPYNLVVVSDKIRNKKRTVILHWNRPLNTTGNITYRIYRNDAVIATIISLDTIVQYTNSNFLNNDTNPYRYYITAVYSGIESLKSNEVTTTPG